MARCQLYFAFLLSALLTMLSPRPVKGQALAAQDPSVNPVSQAKNSAAKKPARLFRSDSVLQLRLSGPAGKLLSDRGEKSSWYRFTLHTLNDNGDSLHLPVQLKTRGNSRKDPSICNLPPIWINLKKGKSLKGTPFAGQDRIKIVMPCADPEYVLREYFVYKMFNLVTPMSLQVRLLKIQLTDSLNPRKNTELMYAFAIEDMQQLAARHDAAIFVNDKLLPERTDSTQFHLMAVFQFLIGNTDWSSIVGHNTFMIKKPDRVRPYVIPYDFDMSGMVNAPYAVPPPILPINTVMQRMYRGYCLPDLSALEPIFARFEELKPSFYRLYENNPLLKERTIKHSVGYLNSYYAMFDKPRQLKAAYLSPCTPLPAAVRQ